jgi:hypothetical protein
VTTIPDTFALISVPLSPNFMTRGAFVTFGVANQAALATPPEIAEAVWDPWNDNFGSRIDTDVLMGPIHVQQGTGSGVNSGDGTSSAAGTSALDACPPQVAILIQKFTGLGGRANRGRMYLPFAMDQTGVSQGGQIDPTVVTATTDAMNGLIADLAAADLPMVILHAGAGLPAEVISGTAESLVATQRRRVGR